MPGPTPETMPARRVAVVALVVLAACGGEPTDVSQARGTNLTAATAAAEEVVARVNGAPILRQQLVEQMRGGEGRRAALQALVREELLAQEAARRGLASHPSVSRMQRRAMANRLVARFGEGFSKADIPRDLLEKAYNLNRIHFQRPELVRVSHVLVLVRPGEDEGRHRHALRAARHLRQIAASGRLSPDEFRQLPDLLPEQERDGLPIKVETLNTPRRGLTVPEFADAAFALKKPGDVSPVVATSFGYHVIYLVERIPARNVTLEQAEAELRDKTYEQAKSLAFERWAAGLERRAGVKLMPYPLRSERR